MKKISKKYLGFTIVELIIIIVIIGIIAVISVMSYDKIFSQVRNSQRASNTKLLAEALEKYYDKNGEYPGCSTMTNSNISTVATNLGNINSKILTSPLATDGTNSIICSDIDLSTGDTVAYFADEASSCQTGNSCSSFELKYREELTGDIKTIKSKHGIKTFALKMSTAGSEDGNAVVQLSDNSYIIVGNGLSSAMIARYSNNGSKLWAKTLNGVSLNTATDVIIAKDGGIIVVGTTTNYVAGYIDAYMSKFWQDGTLVWTKVWGSANDDYADTVIESKNGGFIVSGTYNGYTNRIGYVAKFDSNANMSWLKTIGGSEGIGDLIELSDGSIVAVSDNVGSLVVRLSAAGGLVWSKYPDESGNNDLAYSAISNTSDGGYVIAGYIDIFEGDQILLQKFDSSNNLSWQKTYSKMSISGASSNTRVDVIQTPDSGYAVTTSYPSNYYDVLLLKLSNTGAISWAKTYGGSGPDSGGSVIVTNDKGLAVFGSLYDYDTGTYDDLFLLKMKSNGVIANCQSVFCVDVDMAESSLTITNTVYTPTITSVNPTVMSQNANLNFTDLILTNTFFAQP